MQQILLRMKLLFLELLKQLSKQNYTPIDYFLRRKESLFQSTHLWGLFINIEFYVFCKRITVNYPRFRNEARNITAWVWYFIYLSARKRRRCSFVSYHRPGMFCSETDVRCENNFQYRSVLSNCEITYLLVLWYLPYVCGRTFINSFNQNFPVSLY